MIFSLILNQNQRFKGGQLKRPNGLCLKEVRMEGLTDNSLTTPSPLAWLNRGKQSLQPLLRLLTRPRAMQAIPHSSQTI